MARRIVVTGATGTVGGHLMAALAAPAAAGLEVLGAARSAASADALRAAGHGVVHLDYDDPQTLRPALRGADAVFLATGYTVDMVVQEINRYADSEFRYADKSDEVAIEGMVREYRRQEEAKRRFVEGR